MPIHLPRRAAALVSSLTGTPVPANAVVLGLLAPDSGSIEIDGQQVVGMSGRERERIMAKFDKPFRGAALFDSLSVWPGPVAEIDDSANGYVDQLINRRAEGPIQMEVLKT